VGACAAGVGPARAQDAHLAGVMRWTDQIDRDWPLCGAWLYPVGDSLDFERVPPDGTPAYTILRGVSYGGNGVGIHQGVDLANHRARGVVRAAASGVVVCTDKVGAVDYGLHVVLAHRDETGAIVYSVYAHLRAKSIRVHVGQSVQAGERIARVGRTGNATTDHLHFEIRTPDDVTARWELSPFTDPLPWIAARLPTERPDSAWARAYLAWAECAALVPRGVDGDQRLGRDAWQRLVVRALRGDPDNLAPPMSDDADEAPEVVVPPRAPRRAATPGDKGEAEKSIGWKDLMREVSALDATQLRVKPCAVSDSTLRRDCAHRLGWAEPRRHRKELAKRPVAPTVSDACLLVAEFAASSAPH
jgi:Peptidase family M23